MSILALTISLLLSSFKYHTLRNHLSLNKGPPLTRPAEPPELGAVIVLPRFGGLHYRYGKISA
jgi:hypothetical protein